jgi:hypothetical protein
MNKTANIILGIICAATMNLANASAVTFFDGTFTNSNWTSSINISQGPFSSTSYSGTQVASGGNPGDYRLDTRTWGLGTQAQVFNLNSLAAYDPSKQGAISSIGFSEDIIGFGTNGSTYGDGLLLEQGGQLFVGAFVASPLGTNTWQNRSSIGLTAVDFTPFFGLSHPDFSMAGSPIMFGYARTNTIFGGVATVQDGIDNWSVTATTVPAIPEPETYVLMLAGLLTIGAVARRRTIV